MIIRDKKNWEIIYWKVCEGQKSPYYFKNCNDGREIPAWDLEYDNMVWILGELGCRELFGLENYKEGQYNWKLKNYKEPEEKVKNSKFSNNSPYSEEKTKNKE